MSRVTSATLLGVDGVAVEVEVRLSSQLPRVDVVGLPEAAVRESAARVRAAIASAAALPDRRITVNLAPAGVRKSGARPTTCRSPSGSSRRQGAVEQAGAARS